MTYENETSRALFVDDVEGGCLVQCEECVHEQVVDFVPFPVCEKCGRQLVYPSGASW